MLEVCTFIILQTEEGVTSFNKNNLANFSGEKKKYNQAFQSVYIYKYSKNVKLNLALVVILYLLLESKCFFYYNLATSTHFFL